MPPCCRGPYAFWARFNSHDPLRARHDPLPRVHGSTASTCRQQDLASHRMSMAACCGWLRIAGDSLMSTTRHVIGVPSCCCVLLPHPPVRLAPVARSFQPRRHVDMWPCRYSHMPTDGIRGSNARFPCRQIDMSSRRWKVGVGASFPTRKHELMDAKASFPSANRTGVPKVRAFE